MQKPIVLDRVMLVFTTSPGMSEASLNEMLATLDKQDVCNRFCKRFEQYLLREVKVGGVAIHVER